MHLPPLVVPISTIDLLSQEMIDNVIDALYEGIDPEALWRFTKQHIYSYPLVCKTFVSRCQTHLYHEIRFGYLGDCEGSDRAERISKLADILDQSPHIGKHVRATFLTLPEHDNTWIYSNLTFLRILPLITQHLQKLTIDGRMGSFIGDPEEAAIRFFIPFISPSISSLFLVLMNTFPLALLSAFLNLKLLSLKFCGGFDHSVTPHATTNYPELQLLECSYGYDCLQALLPRGQWSPATPVDLTALKIIKMYPRTESDIRITGQLVRAASSSLEEVFILRDEVTDWAPLDTGALSFNQTPRLKFIQLQFELQDPSTSKNGLLGIFTGEEQTRIAGMMRIGGHLAAKLKELQVGAGARNL
ncbi:hypothetical protein NLJ89_g2045 [Agrocybe chaxingu]|uniref:Uncharacterized protein n=1 Tax=Agrocybe chaxingu TaxID=84603 RepID=A0A9W8KCN5_9AGAR|nr:hypothetical protein NLJ89_g2045 [Agrocybe chaxingu]